MNGITTRLDSFDHYHQIMVQGIRDGLAAPYLLRPTIVHHTLPGVDQWLSDGLPVIQVPFGASAGYEAIGVMLRSYRGHVEGEVDRSESRYD